MSYFDIPASMFRFAESVRDPKAVDPRFTSIMLYKHGYIASCNGHVAYITNHVEVGCVMTDDYMIVPGKKVAAKAELVKFYSDKSMLEVYDKNGVMIEAIPYTFVEGKQIDWLPIWQKHELSDTGKVNLDPRYMKLMAQFKDVVDVRVGKEGTPSMIHDDNQTLLVMPCTYNQKNGADFENNVYCYEEA